MISAQVILLGVAELCAITLLGALHILPGEAIAALLTTSITIRARLVAAESSGGPPGNAPPASGPANALPPKAPAAAAGILGLLLNALGRMGAQP